MTLIPKSIASQKSLPGPLHQKVERRGRTETQRKGRNMADATVATDPIVGIEQKLMSFTKTVATRTAIAQTPKQLVWTLNKAKMYRYVPVVPKEQRHRLPLLLVFALMNRPYILDLRPGHSFIEYMIRSGYDVYLLDWGSPGLEDKNLKFDDYVLDYM